MSYEVTFRPEAAEDLGRLENTVAQRILTKIRWLADNCALINHKSLLGELAGLFKQRVGDYRIIYMVDSYNHSIEICLVGHRKDIYKLK